MRTTVTIDDDVLRGARQLASATGRTLGQAISELARSALAAGSSGASRNGIVLLPVNPDARGATLEEVNALRDEPE